MPKTPHTQLSAHRRQVALVRQSFLLGARQREQIAQNASRRARLAI